MAKGKAAVLALAFSALVTDWAFRSLPSSETSTPFSTGISHCDEPSWWLPMLFFSLPFVVCNIFFFFNICGVYPLYIWQGSISWILQATQPHPCLFPSAAGSFHRYSAPQFGPRQRGSWSSCLTSEMFLHIRAGSVDSQQGSILQLHTEHGAFSHAGCSSARWPTLVGLDWSGGTGALACGDTCQSSQWDQQQHRCEISCVLLSLAQGRAPSTRNMLKQALRASIEIKGDGAAPHGGQRDGGGGAHLRSCTFQTGRGKEVTGACLL